MNDATAWLRRPLNLLLLLGAAFSCAPVDEAPLSPGTRAAIADTVAQATRAFAATYSGLDGRLLVPFLRADSAFRWLDGETFVDHKGWMRNAAPFSGVRAGDLHINSLHVAVISPVAAVVSAYAMGTWTNTVGHTDRYRERTTYVWTRTDGVWRLLHFHSTEVPNTRR
jgi:hypothetical protein